MYYALIRLCAVSLLIFASGSAVFAKKANVLLIITDEHNFRTLGCYRDLLPREQAEMWGRGAVVPTPNLDRIADQGVICTRAYATAPVCSPCRAAMITGRYPHNTGVPTNNKVLDQSIPTLADRLGDAGYRTSFIGKWHLGGDGKPEWKPKVDGGFQSTDFMFNRGHWKKFVIENGKPAVGAKAKGQPSYAVDDADEESFSTDWLTNRAIEFINEADSDKPFFTVISYPDPHGPNTVRAPYDHRFDALPFAAPRTYETGIAPPKWLGGSKNHPVFRGQDMSRYFGMVQCIDDNLGRLLEELEKTDRLDDTLIVMTSDHGDLCYEHDRQNKGNPYEGSARVPMLLHLPGVIKANQVYVDPVGTVDVTPTILGLLDLDGSKADEGRDLSTILREIPNSNEHADTSKETELPITFLRNSGESAGWVAAVDRRYKLILSVNDKPWLFDAQQDPDELLNFYMRPGTEGVAERLAKAMETHAAEVKDPFYDNPRIAQSLASVLGKPVASAKPSDRPTDRPSDERAVADSVFLADWKGSRRWIGPNWWANPLTDWNLRNGSVSSAAAADRTLCLLPAETAGNEAFKLSVVIQRSPSGSANTAAGFRIGRRGGIDDYRHSLVHATEWIDATLRSDGSLSIEDSVSEAKVDNPNGRYKLTLDCKPIDGKFQLTLTAVPAQVKSKGNRKTQSSKPVRVNHVVEIDRIKGGISLLSDGPQKPGGSVEGTRYQFQDFSITGRGVELFDDRSFGPILWSQYTLHREQLRIQAQLAPLGPRQNHKIELWLGNSTGDPAWKLVDTVLLDKLSRTARFTVDQWRSDQEKRYQIRFRWRGKNHVWSGVVRRQPDSKTFKLACFSCDNGYLFPIPAMVNQVKQQNPDMVFFAGDQIYESYGGFGVARGGESETAMLDYLRKYYQFGWTWREILRDRPSVILPDDHDVFQGNIWGHGGRKLPAEANGKDWTWGGYLMSGDWVNAVERTQVGHLPDPAVDITLPIGIKPYFTSLCYGGLGFAILEDRKFKTGPKSLSDDARTDGIGGQLLGPEQESFLQEWANDWDGHEIKCALSQTIFCRAATHTGKNLKRTKSYFDSGAWPKEARDRVVRILGDCNAFAIHGDQHLGVLLRHGIDDFDDGGFAFMVPGTANGFPRAWWPGAEKNLPSPEETFTGKFHDDAGNPLHILAVGNPEPGSNELKQPTNPMEVGYRKGSGYGMVEFDLVTRSATVSLYRLGDQEEVFPGFPQTIQIGGKPESR